MADDSDSDEEFVLFCLLLAAVSQYTSAVYKCRVWLVWTRSWIAARPRGWRVGVYPSLLHELQTADAQAYRARRLLPTEMQLLYTSHIGRYANNTTPEDLLIDLSSEGLYRQSSACCCLHHTLSRPITTLRLWKKTFQNRTCANHWNLFSKGENLRKLFMTHMKFSFESYFRKNFPVCHNLNVLK